MVQGKGINGAGRRQWRKPGPAIILYMTRALRHFADGALAVLLPAYLIAIGFSIVDVGVLSAAALLGSSGITIACGYVASRFDLRSVLLAFSALMAVTGLAFASFDSYWPLLIVACLGTLNPAAGNNSVFVPMEHAALANAVPPEKRTMAFASYATSGAVAAALGALAAGLVEVMKAHGYTLPEAVRTLFVAYAIVGVASGGLYALLPARQKLPVKPGSEARPPALGPSKGIVYQLAALFAIDSFASGFVVQSLLVLWLYQRFEMTVAGAGLFFFWTGILSALSLPVAGWLAKRIGLINTMVWTHIPASILLILAALSPWLYVALGLLLVRALLASMDTPARASYLMAIVTPPERPAAGSLTNAPRTLAAGLSPAIAGVLFASYGGAVLLLLCGGFKLLYAGLLYANFRNLRPPEEKR